MNKKCGQKQPILRNRWFHQGDLGITQMINFLNKKNQLTQKRILKVLEEKRVGLAKKLNLSSLKPKCFNYQVAADYKICIKGHKYGTCTIFC